MLLIFIILTFVAVFAGIIFFTKSKRELPLQLYLFGAIVIIGLFYTVYIEFVYSLSPYPIDWHYDPEIGEFVFLEEDSSTLMTRRGIFLLLGRAGFAGLFVCGGFMLYAIHAYDQPKGSTYRKQALWKIAKFIFSLKG